MRNRDDHALDDSPDRRLSTDSPISLDRAAGTITPQSFAAAHPPGPAPMRVWTQEVPEGPDFEPDRKQLVQIQDRTDIIDGSKSVTFWGTGFKSGKEERQSHTSTNEKNMKMAEKIKELWGKNRLEVIYDPEKDEVSYRYLDAKDK